MWYATVRPDIGLYGRLCSAGKVAIEPIRCWKSHDD